jgi:hypothetical protein
VTQLHKLFAITATINGEEMILRTSATRGAMPMIAFRADELCDFYADADAICSTYGVRWAVAQFKRHCHGPSPVQLQEAGDVV